MTDSELDQLRWLRERGFDVDAEIGALQDRRHEEALREDAEFDAVVGPIRDEFPHGTQIVYRGLPTLDERLAAASGSKVYIDTVTGTKVGGNLDHNQPPGAHPGYDESE